MYNYPITQAFYYFYYFFKGLFVKGRGCLTNWRDTLFNISQANACKVNTQYLIP